MRLVRIGELTVRLSGGRDGQGGGDGPLVVLCHGFGAGGDDLVPLGEALAQPAAVRFAFPAAPHDLGAVLGAGARAWWMIDMAALQRELAGRQPPAVRPEDPVGMSEARAALAAVLDALAPPGTPLVLGGFSQGAILACDLALRDERALAGLVLLSSTFLAADAWRPRMAARAGLPVLQTHGRADPILPFALAESLRFELAAAGLAVDFVGFAGGHEIPPVALQRCAAFLRRVLGGSVG